MTNADFSFSDLSLDYNTTYIYEQGSSDEFEEAVDWTKTLSQLYELEEVRLDPSQSPSYNEAIPVTLLVKEEETNPINPSDIKVSVVDDIANSLTELVNESEQGFLQESLGNVIGAMEKGLYSMKQLDVMFEECQEVVKWKGKKDIWPFIAKYEALAKTLESD